VRQRHLAVDERIDVLAIRDADAGCVRHE
jgi:hypothetical protein